MDSKLFGIFLLFTICSSFIYGTPVGNSRNGEILNPDALTTLAHSETPNMQNTEKAVQGNFLVNATEIKSNNSIATSEKSVLPIETITATNNTIGVNSKVNYTVVPGNNLPEPAFNEKTVISTTAVTSTTTAAAATTTPTTSITTTASITTPTTPHTPTPTTPTPTPTPTPSTTPTPTPSTSQAMKTWNEISLTSPVSVKSEKMENDGEFDGPSFIGGIVLAFGLTGIGFVAYKFCKSRMGMNYIHF